MQPVCWQGVCVGGSAPWTDGQVNGGALEPRAGGQTGGARRPGPPGAGAPRGRAPAFDAALSGTLLPPVALPASQGPAEVPGCGPTPEVPA